MRLGLRAALLAAMSWRFPKSQRGQEQRRDRQEVDASTRHGEKLASEMPLDEWAAFQTLIREIHHSEQDQQAAERELAAAQLRTAKALNRITAVGAIVGAISSLGVIGSLVIAKIAADDAHMALVAANRAWIGPVSATLGAIPSAPPADDIPVPLPFRNTGHEPATDASIVGGSDSILIDATYDEIHAREQSFEDYCFSIPAAKGAASAASIVVFPGGNASNDYNASITIRSDLIDWDVVYGRKYVYVHACVIYQTFDEVRHTSVCYYAQAGKTIGSLPFCDKGNKAD
jgi:hypothetical protein